MVVEGERHTYFTGPELSVWLPSVMYLEKTSVGLVGTAPPVIKSLDQVFWEAGLCSSCGYSYSIAVATIGRGLDENRLLLGDSWWAALRRLLVGCSEETLGGLL